MSGLVRTADAVGQLVGTAARLVRTKIHSLASYQPRPVVLTNHVCVVLTF